MRDGMRVLSLFSGIGGFDLGLERAGMTIVGQVEIDPYCLKVLEKHWPNVKRMKDIHDVRGDEFGAVELVAGGFPCQPVSHAGKRQAQNDARWLWPEFARLIRAIRPRYVLVENVSGLLDGSVADVLGDLAESRYDAEWDCIPAAAVGAPHLRDRVWLLAYPGHDGRGAEHGQQQEARPAFVDSSGTRDVAYTDRGGRGGWPHEQGQESPERGRFASRSKALADAGGNGLEGPVSDRDGKRARPLVNSWRAFTGGSSEARTEHWRVEPDVGRVAHGIPQRVDRLRGLGNAVVPQIVEYLGRRILELDR